jgi:hypothetical protein
MPTVKSIRIYALVLGAVWLAACVTVGNSVYPQHWPPRLAGEHCFEIRQEVALRAVESDPVTMKTRSLPIWDVFGVEDSSVKTRAVSVLVELVDGASPRLLFLDSERQHVWEGSAALKLKCVEGTLTAFTLENAWTEDSNSLLRGRFSYFRTGGDDLVVHVAGKEVGTALILIPFAAKYDVWLRYPAYSSTGAGIVNTVAFNNARAYQELLSGIGE